MHIHGYTERFDSRATYSSPSVPGLLMAVGNVGEKLAPYTESDTFLSRDGGFTWEEIHKDAHLWEFGDSGSVLVLANDEEATDPVLFSTNEGLTWREYKFSQEKIRVRSIVTVPKDTSRKFILFGHYPRSEAESVAVHLDFSSLTHQQCNFFMPLVYYTQCLLLFQAFLTLINLKMMIANCGVWQRNARSDVSLEDRSVIELHCEIIQ